MCHFSNGLSRAGFNLSTAIVPNLEPITRPLGSEVGLGFEELFKIILEFILKRSLLVEISFKRLFRDLQAWLAGSAMQHARKLSETRLCAILFHFDVRDSVQATADARSQKPRHVFLKNFALLGFF